MKHQYTLTGMTCGGCKATVEKELSSLEDITKVDVDLQQGEVSLEMNKHVSIETLQSALSDKYRIALKENHASTPSPVEVPQDKSKWAQLTPLFLILGYIGTASVLLHYKDWNYQEMMLDFMGLFYIVFSFFKLLDLKGFPDSFRMYDPLAKRVALYGWIYPFIEIAMGLMFLMRFEISIALIITLVVLGITTIGVTRTLLDKKSIRCACLGTALNLPMTEATFIENAIMIIMAIIMLI